MVIHGRTRLTVFPEENYSIIRPGRKETFEVPQNQELLGFEMFYFTD
jgi:hypothetical protein